MIVFGNFVKKTVVYSIKTAKNQSDISRFIF